MGADDGEREGAEPNRIHVCVFVGLPSERRNSALLLWFIASFFTRTAYLIPAHARAQPLQQYKKHQKVIGDRDRPPQSVFRGRQMDSCRALNGICDHFLETPLFRNDGENVELLLYYYY